MNNERCNECGSDAVQIMYGPRVIRVLCNACGCRLTVSLTDGRRTVDDWGSL